ncbi:HalOD1 output domain-containing protein [Natrinema amylolyticum]|uniref:HalOD1 output domain-containing protein n=1 Tax=Natrinema amylolyticum TaxID=2878679 RepID=UPI001CF9F72C|nr:HalOD1 output domain-containing protein [Natrinema amylolyticum]
MKHEIAEDDLVVEYEIPENESPSVATVRAVSSIRECDPKALTPLYEAIDPDALNDLCESRGDESDGVDCTIEFVFSDYHITVDSDECLTIRAVGE